MPSPILAAVIPELVGIFGDALQTLFPDTEVREQKRLEYTLKVQEVLNQVDMAQLQVNQEEAKHASIFVAGWRPFIGWVCGGAFAYHYILQPFLVFLFAAAGRAIVLPQFDMEMLIWVLGGMLGLGGMRTMEKVKGVTTGLAGPMPWAGKK